MRIAYLCDHSPLDRNLYSGGNARIHDALRAHAGDVDILDTGWHRAEAARRLIDKLPEAVSLRARWRARLALSRIASGGVARDLAAARYDVLFGAYAFQTLANLTPPCPLVTAYTSDATQTVYRLSEVGQTFGRRFRGGSMLDAWVERHERAVFRACDLVFWPSQWLWDAALARYGLDPDRCHMVPWGANIDEAPEPEEKTLLPDTPLRLLLIGRDWFAKGGPVAFDTMNLLRDRGIDARLTVIGCVPPEFHVNEWVTVHPQLNKAVPDELAAFNAAFRAAHFLVQPSFESYGFAFCEASAHGLPSLCLRVGGVPVWDGVNGHALPPESAVADFADLIQTYLQAPERYAALSRAARDIYEKRLNWDAWGRIVAEHLREAVARKKSATG